MCKNGGKEMKKRSICFVLLYIVLIITFNFSFIIAAASSDNIADEVAVMFLKEPMTTKSTTTTYLVGKNAQIIGVDGKIYCFGNDSTLIYDILNDSWKETEAMKTKRSEYSLAEVNGTIYLIGGINQNTSQPETSVDTFNTFDLSWGIAANIPNGSYSNYGATVCGENIYYYSAGYLYVYNTNEKSWSSGEYKELIGEYTLAAIDNKIIFTSNSTDNGNKTYAYDIINGVWTECQPRPIYNIDNTYIGKYKLLNFNDILLCVEYGGSEKNNSKVKYAYVPEKDTWVVMPELMIDSEINDNVFTMYNNQLFVFTVGDYDDGKTKSRISYTYFTEHSDSNPVTAQDMIAVGNRHILNCTSGTLMAKGDNSYGQLGDGTTASTEEFVYVQTPWSSDGEFVRSVAASGNMSYVITNKNNLYAWGQNDKSQLGNGNYDNVIVPEKVADNVLKVASGEGHTIILKGTKNIRKCLCCR